MELSLKEPECWKIQSTKEETQAEHLWDWPCCLLEWTLGVKDWVDMQRVMSVSLLIALCWDCHWWLTCLMAAQELRSSLAEPHGPQALETALTNLSFLWWEVPKDEHITPFPNFREYLRLALPFFENIFCRHLCLPLSGSIPEFQTRFWPFPETVGSIRTSTTDLTFFIEHEKTKPPLPF